MKKIISLIIALFSIAMVSCNNTKVLEENTKENEVLNKYKITERTININDKDILFKPLFYDEDGVNGILSTSRTEPVSEDETRGPYIINESGELIKEENKWFAKEGINYIDYYIKSTGKTTSYRGVYSEGIYTRDKKFYYIDLEKNIKFELEYYDKAYFEMYYDFGDISSTTFQVDDNYYIEETSKRRDSEVKEEKSILIVDIKNETYYTTGIVKMELNRFYYDEKEKSIMALDTIGQIRKVILKDGKIYFEDYKKFDFSKVGIETINGDTVTRMGYFNKCGDYLIISFIDDKGYKDVLYNISTNEIKIMDEEVFIINEIENTEFFVVSHGNKLYLAEIGDKGEFDLIFKLADDSYYQNIIAKANKEGNSIFFELIKFEENTAGKSSYVKDVKYSFLEIEEK
ncbi:hypothetical protein UT300007_17560 [Clostridium sp. CTA-7]